MGILSGVFGDSEKESKTEINVVNVYEDKNNPQARKIAGDAVIQLLENNEFSTAASKRMPADFKLTEEQAQTLVKTIDKLKKCIR
ncbi:MAG: hypothetical protein II821_05250 [Treponema sp.]|nr:hypothetical protein [Treponema sp.]